MAYFLQLLNARGNLARQTRELEKTKRALENIIAELMKEQEVEKREWYRTV